MTQYQRIVNEGGEGYDPSRGNRGQQFVRDLALSKLAQRAVAEKWTKERFEAERKAAKL